MKMKMRSLVQNIFNKFFQRILFQVLPCFLGLVTVNAGKAMSGTSRMAAPKVFLHLICDGGMDSSMVFDWKGGAANSYAIEAGAAQRTSLSGLQHVSHGARPSVDSFYDQWGNRLAVLNGVGAPDLGAGARHGPALEVEITGRRRLWLSAYVEDAGKGRAVPVVIFPGIKVEGTAAEMALVGRVPANLMTTTPAAAIFPAAVRERLFRDLRIDFSAYGAQLRAGSGDAIKGRGYDKQFRMQQVFDASVPGMWTAVYNGAQPDFVNQSKLALEMFSSQKSLAAFVRVGASSAWASNAGHFSGQSINLESLFSGLDAILDHAYTLGLQNQLVLVVSGQYGRTPWLNAAGGKDPWPVSSMMFWGNGVRSKVTGATDDVGRGIKIDPRFGTTTGDVISLDFQNAYASMLFLAGTNYRKWTAALPVSGLLEVR